MIVDTNEHPIPPAEIVERLKQIDPRLGLTFGETLDPATDKMRPAWGFTMDWLPTDPRHKLVQDGKMPLDGCFDVLSFLPGDCGVDEAYAYVVKTFKSVSGDRADIKAMLERCHAFNKARQEEILRPTMELAEELIACNKHRIRSDAVRKHKVETKAKQDSKLREYMEQ